MLNLMKVLKFLVETHPNSCATLNSEIYRNEDRNSIDDLVDNDHDDKSGKLAYAWPVWFPKTGVSASNWEA